MEKPDVTPAANKKITMTDLLRRFDPAKHRHDLMLDVSPIGTETKEN